MPEYGMVTSSAPNAGGGVMAIINLAILVLAIVTMWKIFAKAGVPGWKSLIPFYNVYVEFQIVYGKDKGWKFLLLLIPLYNIYVSIKMIIDMAKCYGKSVGFAMGMLFLSIVFLPILAFGDAKYVGPVEK